MSKKAKIGWIVGLVALVCIVAIVLVVVFSAKDDRHEHALMHHEAVAATCLEDGSVEYWSCSECGKNFADANASEEITELTIPAVGHTPGEAVRENEKAATCTEAGSYEEVVYCTVCEEELSRETKEIAALGHSFTQYVSNNDAKCTKDGTETAKCDRCDATDTRTDEDSALGHDWVETITKEPTCTVAGEKVLRCSRCDETKTEAVPATGHTPGEAVRENEKAATCEEAGSYEEVVYCTVCHEEISSKTETIASLGHDWDEGTVTTPATCTQEGVKTFACSRCDATRTEVIEKTPHTPGEAVRENEKAALCETAGYYEEVVYCTVCKQELSRETVTVEALGHDWDDGVVTTPATCTKEGVKTFTCSRCKETKTEAIDKLPHTPSEAIRENEVEASCEEAGSYEEVVYCTVCKQELSRETVTVEALGHDWDDGVVTTPATCTQAGEKTVTCSRCKETKTESVAALGHDWGEGKVTTEPTCTKEGVKTFTCSRCKETQTEAIDKLPHTPGKAVRENEVEASCEEAGSYDEVVRCSACREELSRNHVEVAALGHAWNEGVVTTEATCTKEGVKTFTCSRCQATKEESIEKIPHDYQWVVDIVATCTQEGTRHQECSVCHVVKEDSYETIEKAAHSYEVNQALSDYTECEGGSKVSVCSVCSAVLTEQLKGKGHQYYSGTCTVCGDKEPTNIFTASSVSGSAGGTVTVTITLGGTVKNAGFVIEFSYDTDVLSYVSYSQGEYSLMVNGTESGEVTFMSSSASNYTSGGTVITMTFLVKNTAEPGSYDLYVNVTDIKEVWKDHSIHSTAYGIVLDGQLTIN